MKLVTYLIILITIFVFANSCTDENVSDLFLNADGETKTVDTPVVSIVLSTLNDDDREAIFKNASTLIVEIEGFLEPLVTNLAFNQVANTYVSVPIKVFASTEYTINRASIIDENKGIVAICPLKAGTWANNVSQALPINFTSASKGNKNVELMFLPAAGGSLELTGYDYSDFPNSTLPSLKIEAHVLDDDDFDNFISSSITVRRKANNTVIIPKTTANDGKFQLEFYYYDEKDVFVFEVEGYTKKGFRTTQEEKTAKFIFDAYDLVNPKNTNTQKQYQLYLK